MTKKTQSNDRKGNPLERIDRLERLTKNLLDRHVELTNRINALLGHNNERLSELSGIVSSVKIDALYAVWLNKGNRQYEEEEYITFNQYLAYFGAERTFLELIATDMATMEKELAGLALEEEPTQAGSNNQ